MEQENHVYSGNHNPNGGFQECIAAPSFSCSTELVPWPNAEKPYRNPHSGHAEGVERQLLPGSALTGDK